MDYDEWLESVPGEITGDALWNVKAYRLALYVAELGWQDVTILKNDRRLIGLSDQLYRALGSISANIAEGYSRSTGMDRARFTVSFFTRYLLLVTLFISAHRGIC